MDPAIVAQGLQRLGFAPSPENVRRAQEMIANDPSIVDRLMGLQGGAGGESGAGPSVMMSQLDKLAGTGSDSGITVGNGRPDQPPLPQAPLPENIRDNSPAPVTTSAPSVSRSGTSAVVEPPSGTGVAPTRSPVANTNSSYIPDESGMPATGNTSAPSGSLDWLKSLLGISAAGGAGAAAAGQRALPSGAPQLALPAPQARLTGPTPSGPMSLPPPGSLEALMLSTNRIPAISAPSVGTEIDTSAYDGRPVNTGDPERITPPRDRPTNLEGTTQKQGPYDGKPTNVDEPTTTKGKKISGKEALIRAMRGVR